MILNIWFTIVFFGDRCTRTPCHPDALLRKDSLLLLAEEWQAKPGTSFRSQATPQHEHLLDEACP